MERSGAFPFARKELPSTVPRGPDCSLPLASGRICGRSLAPVATAVVLPSGTLYCLFATNCPSHPVRGNIVDWLFSMVPGASYIKDASVRLPGVSTRSYTAVLLLVRYFLLLLCAAILLLLGRQVLASYPRSGNSLLRKLLEEVTNVPSFRRTLRLCCRSILNSVSLLISTGFQARRGWWWGASWGPVVIQARS